MQISMKRTVALAACAALLTIGTFAQHGKEHKEGKEIDSVRTIFVNPIGPDPDSMQFQALLKQELVHDGFPVAFSADKADALMTVEVIVTKNTDQYEVETHGKLADAEETLFWTGGTTKRGTDKTRLLLMAARNIADSIKAKKIEVHDKKVKDSEKK